MLDFFVISQKSTKRGFVEVYPKFIVRTSKDLMIRGGDFYAIWDESNKQWSTDEERALQLIDEALDDYVNEHAGTITDNISVLHMWDAETGMIDRWHKYCQKQMRDKYQALDENLVFSNTELSKELYSSKRLPYALEDGDISAWNELLDVLYSKEEKKKLEWSIGSVVSGESKNLQKFVVLYGSAGTGKSTVLNIMQKLFQGYYSVFDAKALGTANNAFALEAFKTNPLVAIQHDGDLSRIEDNTRLNSLVSHELMTVNEKFKAQYTNRFNSFLFMGTNKPVKITDAKSGILRRLIDVSPTGNKVPAKKYKELMKKIDFELGAIAKHCMDVYVNDPGAYDAYVPTNMMDESNDFYNFIIDNYDIFRRQDSVTLKQAWELYQEWCTDSNIPYPYTKRVFKSELKNYFENFDERRKDGLRNVYCGFTYDKFTYKAKNKDDEAEPIKPWLAFAEIPSAFDAACSDLPAQYATANEIPEGKWADVSTTLKDIDTSKLHYVKVPLNHIVIDFDIPDENGNKSFEKNFEAACQWPETYAELSKSGSGIHLHYIYNGDPLLLSRVYGDHIEIKVYNGKSSLRRKLTKCNNLPIASISSGLPLKEEKPKKRIDKMINMDDAVWQKKVLIPSIDKCLKKEHHHATKPEIDFIKKILDDAYDSGRFYDVTPLRPAILTFAARSSHQSDYCIKLVNTMKFKSENISEVSDSVYGEKPIAFYDVEVFPNLFLINWKLAGDNPVVRMINPTPADVEALVQNYRLIGYNCRRYDNHILWARMMGYTNEQLYNLSQRIVNGSKNAMFGEAYNLSYTDVYDFCSTKQSLKKWEIELGITHHELGLPWDQPVAEELWPKVAEYCDDDVIATEAVFNARKADFIAREILADVAGMTVNSSTNSLTTRIIFGKDLKPQSEFNYRFMGEDAPDEELYTIKYEKGKLVRSDKVSDADYILFRKSDNKPVFRGYTFDHGRSLYRGFEVGEGGFVWAEPGMYGRAITFDVASMHPSSVIAEELFGSKYTKRFKEILDTRIAIKHKDFDKAKKLLGGVLSKYLDNPDDAKALAQALKIAINSVYGLTSAKFENPFRDPRNIDNIVAKRGALFMINLKEAVEAAGGKVIHIKTDSIKILDPTEEISNLVYSMGKEYGYNFEIEHIFEKICLVNNAVYVAKLAEDDPEDPGQWTATGTQFAVPYVFKTLFTHEPIIFEDMCETKSVQTDIYLDNTFGHEEMLADIEVLKKQRDKKKAGEYVLSESERDELDNKISELESVAHTYTFVGKVGQFTPVSDDKLGCDLVRSCTDAKGRKKYGAVTGSKGYKWLESANVKALGLEDKIDRSYYTKLVDDAVKAMSEYGNVDWFLD